jgi:hypothetical protein
MSKVSPEYAPAPPPASPPFGVETASTEPKKTKGEFVFFGRVCACVPEGWLSIIDLLKQPISDRTFYPRKYLSASHEVFGITLALTWAITAIGWRHQFIEHPARPIIGSFNPCFGWDYYPGSHIALVFCSVNVYLTWRYAWLEITRTSLKRGGRALAWQEWFATVSAILLAVASNVWLLLWSIGPNDGNWTGHTAIFVFYALSSYAAVLGNYLEVRATNRAEIRVRHTVFVALYAFAAVFLTTLYFTDIGTFVPCPWANATMITVSEQLECAPPTIPPWLTQTSDVLWMVCVVMITKFTPKDSAVVMTTTLDDNL